MMGRILEEFMVKRGGSVDPRKFKNEIFELLSIPAYDEGKPEILEGERIGSAKKVVEPNDILLSKIVPHIRRCWVVPIRREYRQIASSEWIQFRSDELIPEYLRFFLISDPFHSQFMRTVTGVGGSLLRANPAKVAEIKIPLPPLDDQKRIAHLLGKVEGLIAQRKQHLQQLDDLLKSVFLEMFGDPVRNEKGWNTLPFHKVGQFISGGTPSKSRADYWTGSFPWVSPKDMKFQKISDTEDHISETVFKETTLKRIFPNHILIVVRGMILAHSFPVAINTIEVAINQDMKAIKPVKGINVCYLLNCLNALKRQILKLISTAGHGTRKFDSIAMQKLYVPIPREAIQNQFAVIAEKVEGIKSCYQQSLTDLENLYGALSQKAFKGELDLSRVPLPEQKPDASVLVTKVPETAGESRISEMMERFSKLDMVAMSTAEGRGQILKQWFGEWLNDAAAEQELSSDNFWQRARYSALDYQGDDDASLDFSLQDYDLFKQWLFDAIAEGRIEQTRNKIKMAEKEEFGNQIVLKKVR